MAEVSTITVLDGNGVSRDVATATAVVTALTTIDGRVDGLETLIGTTNSTLTTIDGRVDGLEALLTTQAGYLDGLETLVTATNTKLDTVITSLSVLDDWDESDRAKVNPIVGQAGIAAGAGAVAATVQRMTLASDDPAVAALQRFSQAVEYETVAASQTDQVLGASGAQGDYLSGLLVVPASTSPGNVLIQDGNGSDITVFTGGASSVSNLVPFFIPLGLTAVNGTSAGWKVTTGASVSVIASGNFT
jgi:hypothetical protein